MTAFMDLFKESPEASNAFVFLKHYSTENEEFYDLLSKHALRVLGIVTLIVKEVINLIIMQKMNYFYIMVISSDSNIYCYRNFISF